MTFSHGSLSAAFQLCLLGRTNFYPTVCAKCLISGSSCWHSSWNRVCEWPAGTVNAAFFHQVRAEQISYVNCLILNFADRRRIRETGQYATATVTPSAQDNFWLYTGGLREEEQTEQATRESLLQASFSSLRDRQYRRPTAPPW